MIFIYVERSLHFLHQVGPDLLVISIQLNFANSLSTNPVAGCSPWFGGVP